jgi:hypothetical protein
LAKPVDDYIQDAWVAVAPDLDLQLTKPSHNAASLEDRDLVVHDVREQLPVGIVGSSGGEVS